MLSTQAFGQWTDVVNNDINFEFQLDQCKYNGGNDGFPTYDAEPTMRNNFLFGGASLGWACSDWYTSSTPYQGDPSSVYYWGTSFVFDVEFQIQLEAWESDNSDPCTYTSGDDEHWSGFATLRDGLNEMPVVYPSTDFRPCAWNTWLASGTSWLFPTTSTWDQIWKETWRYEHGDASSDPLSFGTINHGITKADINATRSVSGLSSPAPLQYTDTYGNASADVWYSFSLSQASNVTISLDHGETDFDTYLRLLDSGGNVLVADDDGGTGNTSLITSSLCAGSYKICVEGYNSNTGLYKITVAATAPAAVVVSNVNTTNVSCPGEQDGAINWTTSGGMPGYMFWLNGSSLGAGAPASITGLAEGSYTVNAQDACGSSATAVTVNIVNGDAAPPTAQCHSSLELDVYAGNTLTVVPSQVNNGSTDNCGITSMSVSPNAFTVNDAGFNTITLTVEDANGNQSTCDCIAYMINATGIEEHDEDASFLIYPDADLGGLNVDLSSMDLDAQARIRVLDGLGRMLLEERAVRGVQHMRWDGLATGAYFIQLRNGIQLMTKRFLVR